METVNHFKQVQDKMRCDKIKQKIKKLLVQIDSEKNGAVKIDVFAQILVLHKVILNKVNLQKLQRECRAAHIPQVNNSGEQVIIYREALKRLSIDMEVDEPLMKEWVVRADQQDSAAYTNGFPTSNRSALSMSKSLVSRTNQFLSRHQNSMENALMKALNQGVAKHNKQHNQKLRNGAKSQNNTLMTDSRQQSAASISSKTYFPGVTDHPTGLEKGRHSNLILSGSEDALKYFTSQARGSVDNKKKSLQQ